MNAMVRLVLIAFVAAMTGCMLTSEKDGVPATCAEANQACAAECRPRYAGPRENIYRGTSPWTPASPIACEARCSKNYQACMDRANQRTL